MSDDINSELLKRIEDLRQEIREIKETAYAIRQLVGPFVATFPDGSMLVQSLHGTKYFIDPDDMIISPQIIVYRQWEAELSRLFRSLCTPESVVVDVGANFGYFTCLAGTFIGARGSGKVFAFEPNPKLAKILRRNMEINWSMAPISFHEVAVADFTGETMLHVPAAHGANASLSQVASPDAGRVPVYAVRLDDIIPADIMVDIMKIDVEGHEFGVLKGAEQVIARSPNVKIIMEWSRHQMAQAGVDPLDVLRLFQGFNCYRIELNGDPFAHRESAEWLLAQDYVDVMMCRQ